MSAKWLRIETDFVDHPKVHQLCEMLGDKNAAAYIIRLWSFISKFYPEGRIEASRGVTYDVTLASRVTAIVTACRWIGDGEKFISALICCGFLDKTENGFEAHDWAIYQGKVAESAEKARLRSKKYRDKLKEASRVTSRDGDVASHRDEQPGDAQRDGTLRDVTLLKDGSNAFALTSQAELVKTKPKRKPPNPEVEFARWVGSQTPDEKTVFETYESSTGLALGADWGLLKYVRGKLKAHTADEICKAIRGHVSNPWNREKQNLSLRSMLTDATKIAINAAMAS